MKKKVIIVICIFTLFAIAIISYNVYANKERKDDVTSTKMVSESKKYPDYDKQVSDEEKDSIEKEKDKLYKKLKTYYCKININKDKELVLDDKQEEEYLKLLKDSNRAIFVAKQNKDMINYELFERYIDKVNKKKASEASAYCVQKDGNISILKFVYDGNDMSLLNTSLCWDNKELHISDIHKMKVKSWNYTKKGWFAYKVSVRDTPDMTETINDNSMIRVLPIKKEYRQLCDKYLMPISYQGNNLFFSEWNSDNMKNIDYNGLYEFLYEIKNSKRYKGTDNSNGIEAKEFEKLICGYLPIDKEKLKQYADYDKKRGYYEWEEFGCLNYIPEAFGTSIPEITDIQKLDNGELKLRVDAVCVFIGDDQVITHELIIKISGDDVRYCSNHILNDGIKNIPDYMYRCRR